MRVFLLMHDGILQNIPVLIFYNVLRRAFISLKWHSGYFVVDCLKKAKDK